MKYSLCLQLLAALPLASAQTFSGFTVTIQNKLNVVYGNTSISNGQQLPRAAVLSPPNISSPGHFSATGKAVLIMMDSDVPANSTSRTTLLHWLAPDITGVTDGSNSSFLAIPSSGGVAYQAPTPPQGDYPHRYSFLLFEQPRNFSIPSSVNASTRRGFDLQAFLASSNVGTALAANYMLVANNSGPATTSFPPALYTASSTLASSAAAATATSTSTTGSSAASSAGATGSRTSGTAATASSTSTGDGSIVKAGSGVALLAAVFGVMLL